MKNKNKEIMIVSQVYEEACLWSENMYNLEQTIKKVKRFYILHVLRGHFQGRAMILYRSQLPAIKESHLPAIEKINR